MNPAKVIIMQIRHRIPTVFLTFICCIALVRGEIGKNTGTLLAEDGAFSDSFGTSVSISGPNALVGAWHDDENGEDSGSAYLFDLLTLRQTAQLLPDDHGAFRYFGLSAGIDGTSAVIGSPGKGQAEDDAGETGDLPGTVYVFDTVSGLQTRKLSPTNGSEQVGFGSSVDISGNVILIASGIKDKNRSGAVHIYDARFGIKYHTLRPEQYQQNDRFGESVAIDESIALVGARGDVESGAVYVFDVATGKQLRKLQPEDQPENAHFGCDVDISGSLAIIGAQYDQTNGKHAGSAYLYDVNSGKQLHKLYPTDPRPLAVFGSSVAISGNMAVVGAYGDDDNGPFSGAAYLFDTTTGKQLAKLIPSDAGQLAKFGWAVGIDDKVTVIGAPGTNQKAPGSGSAYLFDISNDHRSNHEP